MKILTPTENPTIETRIPTMDELLEAYFAHVPQLAVEPEQSSQRRVLPRYSMAEYRAGLDVTQELSIVDCEVLS